jgi:DNA-binding MarR family transcriptional regulator
MILLKRLIEAGYIKRTVRPSTVKVGGLKLNADHLTITDEGRKFIESLGVQEL